MSAAISSESLYGPGWLAVVSPGRIQLRTSPDALTYGCAIEAKALHALLPDQPSPAWESTWMYADDMGWDVWLVLQVTT